jgi:hypothetical protein
MSLLVTLHYLLNHPTLKYIKNTSMDSLLRATILLGRVVHHCDKLKQKEQFKVRFTLLFRVGVREFEICGRGFKVRFDPKFNIDIPLLQNYLSTLLLVVPT